jgi:ABC-type glycerol-3-phosphate transport system permease component
MAPRSATEREGHTVTAGRAVVFVILLATALTFVYPLYFMALNSVKSVARYMTDAFGLPGGSGLRLENYRIIVSQFNILLYLRNSAVVVGLSVGLLLLFSVAAGYAFAKIRFPGRATAYVAIFATIFIPGQVSMIPMYVMFARLGLIDRHLAVAVTYLAAGLPAAVMLLTANFRSLPDSLLESAKMDGAGYFRRLISIVLPLGKAAVAILIIFNFIGFWNDMFTPLILLPSQEKKTVMVALARLVTRFASNEPLQMAGLLLSTAPVLAVYLVFQRSIVKGTTLGSFR